LNGSPVRAVDFPLRCQPSTNAYLRRDLASEVGCEDDCCSGGRINLNPINASLVFALTATALAGVATRAKAPMLMTGAMQMAA
jgi:hypothetical protein